MRFPLRSILFSLVFCLGLSQAQAAQKAIGTACSSDMNALDWDAIAQCNGSTFIKAPLMLGAVANPPYASTNCDSAKAGMIQYSGGAFQSCDGGGTWGNLLTSTATIAGNVLLGTSVSATNPHADGDAGTGLYSSAPSTVGIAVGGSNALYVTATGSVGIGTTTPAYKLDVAGTAKITGATRIEGNMYLLSGNFSMDNAQVFYAKNSAGDYEPVLWPRHSDNATYLQYGSAGLYLRNNSGTSTMFLSATNSVGIGTTTPTAPLQIKTNIYFDEGLGSVGLGPDIRFDAQGLIASDSNMIMRVDYAGGGGGFYVQKGSQSSIANLMIIDNSGNMSVTGAVTAGGTVYGTSSTSYGVRGVSTSGWAGCFSSTTGGGVFASSASTTAGHFASTSGSGVYGSSAEGGYGVRGVSATNIGVYGSSSGHTGVAGVATGSTGTSYGGWFTGTAAGVMATDTDSSCSASLAFGNYGGYSTCSSGFSSDIRLKKEVSDISGGLEVVRALRPVTFLWKKDKKNRESVLDHSKKAPNYGFIAQDVLKVLPDLVGEVPTEIEDGKMDVEKPSGKTYYVLDYDGFIAPLVKAVQELDAEVQALRAEVKALRTQGP